MKVKDMPKSGATYDFIFDGKQIANEYCVELESDVAAILHASAKLDGIEYPPAHGRDMTSVCSIYAGRDYVMSLLCDVNTEGEVSFSNEHYF